MRTALLVLTFIAFIMMPANAQRNLKGYFVNYTGDTIKGIFPKYVYWNRNPNEVRFKPENGEEVKLTPQKARMFEIIGQYKFYSFNGTRHLNNGDSLVEPVTAFLKLIFETAAVRLYEFKDTARSNFYLQKQGYQIEELIYSQWIKNDQYVVQDSFKKQIAVAFEKELSTGKLSEKLSTLEYVDDALIDFFEKLVGKPAASPKRLYKPEFFLAAGISINRFKILGNPLNATEKPKYNTTAAPVFSAGVQIYDRRTFGRIYFAPSLTIYRFSNEGKFEREFFGTTTINVEGTAISPAINIGYKLFPGQSFQVYFQGGVGVMFLPNSKLTETFKSYASVPVTDSGTIDLKPTNLNLNIQSGISITRSFSIWASYYVPMKMTSSTRYTVVHKPIQVGIRYLFRKKY